MKKHYRPHVSAAPGFTLIELMVVIAIILVLSTIVISGVGWYKRKTAVSKTQVLVKSVDRALEEYKQDNGFLPEGGGGTGSTEQVYIALYGDGTLEIDKSGKVKVKTQPDGSPDKGNTVYLSILDPKLVGTKSNVVSSGGKYTIVDAWGDELHYKCPADMNPPSEFDLWSLGPNGTGGPTGSAKDTADDIKNW